MALAASTPKGWHKRIQKRIRGWGHRGKTLFPSDTKCHAGRHLLMEGDDLNLLSVPAPESGPENIVQAATGRQWLPLCRRCSEAGYFDNGRHICEVTDLAFLYMHISDEDREQVRQYLRNISRVSDGATGKGELE